MKLAGYSTDLLALDITIFLSSMGCLNTSSASLLNSGNSSKNKTPLWAREISPGLGLLPPPAKATFDTV